MPLIDETFLTVHPRTALWWQQREQCLVCEHVRMPKATKHSAGSMRCRAIRSKGGGNGGGGNDRSCITARDEGSQCGPSALLFKSKGLA